MKVRLPANRSPWPSAPFVTSDKSSHRLSVIDWNDWNDFKSVPENIHEKRYNCAVCLPDCRELCRHFALAFNGADLNHWIRSWITRANVNQSRQNWWTHPTNSIAWVWDSLIWCDLIAFALLRIGEMDRKSGISAQCHWIPWKHSCSWRCWRIEWNNSFLHHPLFLSISLGVGSHSYLQFYWFSLFLTHLLIFHIFWSSNDQPTKTSFFILLLTRQSESDKSRLNHLFHQQKNHKRAICNFERSDRLTWESWKGSTETKQMKRTISHQHI
jgi:hypothetical protein